MNATDNDPRQKDLRPLVLVFFAVGILAVAAFRTAGIDSLSGPAAAPPRLVWQGDSVAAGLYRVPADTPTKEQQLPARLAPLFFKPIPVNQADEELLATIPGIGPVFARKIIEFRTKQGRIKSIAELDAVQGVGPAKLKILQAHLVAD